MTDWADEAVDELCKEFGFDEGKGLDIYDKQLVSQALRAAELRGRVAGMKEAAAMLDGDGKWNCGPSCLADDLAVGWAKAIREAASKLSPT